MFRRILVASDGSAGARAALRIGIDLAKRTGAELSSVSVEESLPRYAATIGEVEAAKEEIDAHFRKLATEARDLAALVGGVELETAVRRGHEVETILDVARGGKFDLLLIGHQGHSRIFERILGSTALSIARLAPCSVLIARPLRASADGMEALKRILGGLDGSPLGRLAFQAALDLARLSGGTVTGLTVREVSPLAGSEALVETYVQQLQTAALEHAGALGIAFERAVRTGHAAQTLCDQAREREADLIVLGATGLEHPWSSTLGGTATRVASEAPCSVLLIRSPRAVLHVRDVMVRGVSSVTFDTPVAEVVELLLRRNVKAPPVVDGRRRVAGIITGGDLLGRGDLLRSSPDTRPWLVRALTGRRPAQRPGEAGERLAGPRGPLTARNLVAPTLITVRPEASLARATRLMMEHQVKRLVVVDADGHLVGLVDRREVLRSLAGGGLP